METGLDRVAGFGVGVVEGVVEGEISMGVEVGPAELEATAADCWAAASLLAPAADSGRQ